jgi:hypothetical protein
MAEMMEVRGEGCEGVVKVVKGVGSAAEIICAKVALTSRACDFEVDVSGSGRKRR